jgi:hypothetical protein
MRWLLAVRVCFSLEDVDMIRRKIRITEFLLVILHVVSHPLAPHVRRVLVSVKSSLEDWEADGVDVSREAHPQVC